MGSVEIIRRLLILDDDSAVLQTVTRMARALGAEVCACQTLGEFDAALSSFAPDIILIDLMMPEFDGIEVLSRVKPHPDVAVYVITGADRRTFEASREVLASSRTQVAGFLQKPFTLVDLSKIVDQQREDYSVPVSEQQMRVAGKPLSPLEFERAVRMGRLEPYFQPIVQSDGWRIKGFEALARIEDDRHGYFAPEYLEYLLEDDELSASLTDLMIERSLRFMAGLSSTPDLTISINVFGINATAEGFRQRLVEQCATYEISCEQVILEMSEASVFDFDEAGLRRLTQLRLAGFGLSVDDFGIGNSSLARLANLPFSELKIDKSFCLALPQSETAEAVVEACLGLARRLDMTVTGEGVESREVATHLSDMGCDNLQGYFFSEALRGDRAIRYLTDGGPKSVS